MGHLKVGAGFGLVKICWFGAAGRRPHTHIFIYIYIYIYIYVPFSPLAALYHLKVGAQIGLRNFEAQRCSV